MTIPFLYSVGICAGRGGEGKGREKKTENIQDCAMVVTVKQLMLNTGSSILPKILPRIYNCLQLSLYVSEDCSKTYTKQLMWRLFCASLVVRR